MEKNVTIETINSVPLPHCCVKCADCQIILYEINVLIACKKRIPPVGGAWRGGEKHRGMGVFRREGVNMPQLGGGMWGVRRVCAAWVVRCKPVREGLRVVSLLCTVWEEGDFFCVKSAAVARYI